jgi:putative transposase
VSGRDDGLVVVKPLLDRVGDFAKLLQPDPNDDAQFATIRNSEGTGRPLGNADFIAGLEQILRRPLARRAPGRKPRVPPDDQQELL